ncbi:YjhX family toxin [Pararhodobacter sp. CCB-MM2]|uniref:YjhX family toxin n=1 Tax=Pararhodobacter sp. CCB-MM2 TaxID=1786003 RepID=UPI00082CDB60|nr:YjhX family toxin [Pararhodobacter sp. CCB-MM2]MCA2010601.1 YjhX family toxin [Cereibacter sphaeroides]
MNISRQEQRVLHVLAQGGCIRYQRGPNGRLLSVDCITHDGAFLTDCTLDVVGRLKRKRLIESRHSSPYRISDLGRRSVRAQLDNRA